MMREESWEMILREQREKRKQRIEELVELNHEYALKFMTNVGSLVEDSIGVYIENRDEAPTLDAENGAPFPADETWYKVSLSEGMSGDGSAFHMYLKKGMSDHLLIFLSGGGVAWNEYTAARPVTGAAVAAGEPNYYWNNLRPFTQIMNINIGITEINAERNPFHDWNMAVIPYSTGDFHVGDSDFAYTTETGEPAVLHFHGKKNVEAALAVTKKYFPSPSKLLLAGDSAGAFAVPAVARPVADVWYPDCPDITLFSDSAQLYNKNWRMIARDVWGADPSVWEPLRTKNITYDWYKDLLSKHPERFRCLYASSTRDYLLSTFFNDMTNKTYRTDRGVREAYYRQLRKFVPALRALAPDCFAFFINDIANPLFTGGQGGTIHTAVRQPQFHTKMRDGTTMAAWLHDAVEGTMYDVNLDLLNK